MPSARSSDSAPVGIGVDLHLRARVAHAHDDALAELALDLRQRALEGGVAGLRGLLVLGHGHVCAAFLMWWPHGGGWGGRKPTVPAAR